MKTAPGMTLTVKKAAVLVRAMVSMGMELDNAISLVATTYLVAATDIRKELANV